MRKTIGAHSPCFIDTNIFLRTLIQEDERAHHECVVFLDAVRSGRIHASTSPLIIAEIVWTLKSFYKLPKDEVLEAVQGVIALRNMRVESEERIEVALELYAKHNVKFVDALIASSEGVQNSVVCVVSYDKEFDRIHGIVRKEPREVLANLSP